MVRFNSKIGVLQLSKDEVVKIHPSPTQTHYITIMNVDGGLCFKYLDKPIPIGEIYELLNKKMLK